MSTTTNLKLFKHDNPETNTEQFDVEKSLNENWDKLDANAGEVANRIQTLENRTNEKDTSQDIEIESLKSENTLLKSQIPSSTVVGETVHLEDSSNMQCQIMPLGASKQETREGYNLVSEYSPHYTSNCTLSNNVFTSSTVSGYGNVRPRFTEITLPANKKHYISCDIKLVSGTSGNLNSIQGYGTSGLIAGTQVENPALSNTYQRYVFEITPTTEYAISGFLIQLNNSTVDAVVDITNLMVSTENVPYEQYGASPSIEYESSIESVGDNINLLNIEDSTNTTGGVTRTIKSGEITLNGTPNDLYYNLVIGTYTAQKTGIYTLMPFKSSTNTNIRLLYQLNGGSFVSNDLSMQIEMNKSDVLTLNLRIDSTSSITNFTLKPKLVLGTSATPYSPYGQGSIEIYNCNDNLFDISKLSSNSKNGITLTKNDNGTITLNGTASDDANFDFYISDIKATTNHKLQLFNLGGSYTNTYVSLYMATDNTWNDFDMLALTTNKITVMPLKEKTYTYARIKVNKGVVCNNLVIGCQVINDMGGTATEYVEGKSQTKALYTQQPFRAIGDVKDRFVKQNGVWYEEHKIARKIFDGTENWLLGTPTYRYYIEINNESEMSNIDITPLSSHFVCTSGTGIEIDYDTIWLQKLSDSSFRINIFNTNYLSDLENFKIWLTELYNAGTPVYVDYVLATPTLIECTPEQVEVLESFNTYKNVTNISSDSIGELEVFYYKDLETLLGGA